jgi:hypothetical protein
MQLTHRSSSAIRGWSSSGMIEHGRGVMRSRELRAGSNGNERANQASVTASTHRSALSLTLRRDGVAQGMGAIRAARSAVRG